MTKPTDLRDIFARAECVSIVKGRQVVIDFDQRADAVAAFHAIAKALQPKESAA